MTRTTTSHFLAMLASVFLLSAAPAAAQVEEGIIGEEMEEAEEGEDENAWMGGDLPGGLEEMEGAEENGEEEALDPFGEMEEAED
jgi:hypothetical protein